MVDYRIPGHRTGDTGVIDQPARRLAARRAQSEAALVPIGHTMTTPLLQVKNLRIEFPTRRGTLTAVDDISFDIAPGEVLGVVDWAA